MPRPTTGHLWPAPKNFGTPPATGQRWPREGSAPAASLGPHFLDDFNRADGPVGNGWTSAGAALTWSVVSNHLEITAGSGDGFLIRVPTGATQHHRVSAVVTHNGNAAGLILRYKDASNFLLATFDNANAFIYERVGGVYTHIGGVGTAVSVGQTLTFEAYGTALRTIVNGELRHNLTVSRFADDLTATGVGFRKDTAGGVGLNFDDFAFTRLNTDGSRAA